MILNVCEQQPYSHILDIIFHTIPVVGRRNLGQCGIYTTVPTHWHGVSHFQNVWNLTYRGHHQTLGSFLSTLVIQLLFCKVRLHHVVYI